MDINLLQAKVADLRHLLSSQRDCLERLLFQLAFNSCSHINIVGSTGSGKSTLAIAAAELFSEQYNIALLSTDIESDAFGAQLAQQWFGQPFNSTLSIAEQIKPESSLLPLLVVVDDAERLSESDLQALNQLPCLCISLSAQPLATANLILTLSKITLNDAEQLLQLQGLNQIELVNKFTLADGDLNLLLAKDVKAVTPEPEIQPLKLPVHSVFYLVIAMGLALLAYLFWPAAHNVDKAQPQPVVTLEPQLDRDVIVDTVTPLQTDSVDALVNAEIDAATSNNTTIKADESLDQAALESDEATTFEHVELATVPSKAEADNTISHETEVVLDSESKEIAETESTLEHTPFLLDEAQLLSMQKQAVAVQLAVLSSETALSRFKTNYPNVEIRSYLRNWQGKVQWVVLLAPFNDAEAARVAMSALPKAISSGPFIKSMQAVQAEIRARQNSIEAQSDGN